MLCASELLSARILSFSSRTSHTCTHTHTHTHTHHIHTHITHIHTHTHTHTHKHTQTERGRESERDREYRHQFDWWKHCSALHAQLSTIGKARTLREKTDSHASLFIYRFTYTQGNILNSSRYWLWPSH